MVAESDSLTLSPGFGQVADLPVFHGQSWEEHVQTWLDLERVVTDQRWRQAAVVASLETHYGEKSLDKFAQEVGISPKRLYEYRAAYRVYQFSGRAENLDFTHYVIASRAENPAQIIEQAATDGLSTRALNRLVTQSTAPPIETPLPTLTDDPQIMAAWRGWQLATGALKAAAPRLASLLATYLEEVQYELSCPAETVETAIYAAISAGYDELDQIASHGGWNRLHVTTWLNRLVELGRLRSWEKPRGPGARGPARTGYEIV